MSDTVPIIQLRERSTLLATDNFPIAPANGGALRVSATNMLAFVQAGITTPGQPMTQYNTPVTGFSLAIAPLVVGQSVRLLLTPAGALATGTIVLPGSGLSATPVDRQEVIVTSTQTITALTVSAGATTSVVSPPTTITAATPFMMWYDAVNGAWYMGV